MDLLENLSGYEDADKLYDEAYYMQKGNYKKVIKMNNQTTFVVPDGVTSIREYAFENCSSLTDVVIPSSVTSIGEYAFYGCSSLTAVHYKGTLAQWNKISIGSYNYALTKATRYYN